jgi:hypothetical protein
VSVAELPLQIAVGLLTDVTVGTGATLIVMVDCPVQPNVLPVTVYVVFIVGVTTTLLPLKVPGIQV